MSEGCEKVRIVQKGGFAGTVALVEVDRTLLDDAGAKALDEACRELAGMASPAAATAELGADLSSYVVETEAAGGERHSFEVADDAAEGPAMKGGLQSIIDRLAGLTRKS